ncbi:M15 family metallopeptidase [Aquimarina agarilytica]|uniref:M15 family metallopeptidase n=1 Tax=Aquimarina agarilytica TaxID=1087449 RepID=UPI0002897554|nr:M15 family metallopeptidase [Aquimarina agarilytica]
MLTDKNPHIKTVFSTILFFLVISIFGQQIPFTHNELAGIQKPANANNPFSLREEVFDAFIKMQKAAALEGIQLKIVSSFRSFERQQQIWNRKYKKYTAKGLSPEEAINKIIEYSTLPGTSRHHWGTDIDIVLDIPNPPSSLLNARNFEQHQPFYPLKKWMDAHAHNYGFELVYTNTAGRKGFKYEPWHYSYVATSKKMLSEYLTYNTISKLDHKKTLGSTYLSSKFIINYINCNILEINPTLISQ